MKTALNVAVRGLFSTPVAAMEVPDAKARNEELESIILAKRARSASIQASNAGGWHSDREIQTWGGPRIGEILDFARELANRLTADRQGKLARPE